MYNDIVSITIFIVQSLVPVWLFVNPWTAALLASLFLTVSWSLLKFLLIELVMPSNHLLCFPLLLPSIFPSIRGFSNELALRMRWPKYWSFSFNISSSKEYSELIYLVKEETDRTGSILKGGLHLGLDYGLWARCPVSMEMTHQLENQALWMEEPQGSYLDSLLPKRIP